jgi:hypothetical protein
MSRQPAKDYQEISGKFAKAFLTAVSLGVGIASGSLYYLSGTPNIVICIAVGLVSGLSYPILGAVTIAIAELSLGWAFPNRRGWDTSDKALRGAVWPGTLLVALMVSTFYGVVDRIYK